jgi:hypothetical protein
MLRFGSRRTLPAELPAPAHEFWAAVRSLPPMQAHVIALHYVEDRSVYDIAELLGVAPGTVKTHLFRARRALAAKLGLEEVRVAWAVVPGVATSASATQTGPGFVGVTTQIELAGG